MVDGSCSVGPPTAFLKAQSHFWTSQWAINPTGKRLCPIHLCTPGSWHNRWYDGHGGFRWAEGMGRLKGTFNARKLWAGPCGQVMHLSSCHLPFLASTSLLSAIFRVVSGRRGLQVIRQDSQKSFIVQIYCQGLQGSKVARECMAVAQSFWVPGTPDSDAQGRTLR